ncbi:hypothetical protein BHE74_00010572 [Ensete ventricosum]|nr:hypothetical protein GW17_00002021 [Ensete ventricosum]RWW81061.1 hypothetical protein BHE74_00010572 [Ensete ventricosum]
MALRRALGWSDGELMRSDAKPCTRLMRHTAGIFTVGGALSFWVLCRLHYGTISLHPLVRGGGSAGGCEREKRGRGEEGGACAPFGGCWERDKRFHGARQLLGKGERWPLIIDREESVAKGWGARVCARREGGGFVGS